LDLLVVIKVKRGVRVGIGKHRPVARGEEFERGGDDAWASSVESWFLVLELTGDWGLLGGFPHVPGDLGKGWRAHFAATARHVPGTCF
jgi:hypothetical protein